MKTKIGIVIPDSHFPLQSNKAMNVVYKAIEIVKPEIFISLGDIGEFETVSQWRYKRRKRPPLEYQLPIIDKEFNAIRKEIYKLNKVLDDNNVSERHLTKGNHCCWADEFTLEYSILEPKYSFENFVDWKGMGWKIHPFNKPLTIGKANFIHGAFLGGMHSSKHAKAFSANIIYGHSHDIQRFSQTNLNEKGIGAWSMGCLKDMTPETNKFVKSGINNWNHAFGIITWFGDRAGSFQMDVIEIIEGKANVWGEIIKG
jgi:predicted phosphodiesterase